MLQASAHPIPPSTTENLIPVQHPSTNLAIAFPLTSVVWFYLSRICQWPVLMSPGAFGYTTLVGNLLYDERGVVTLCLDLPV